MVKKVIGQCYIWLLLAFMYIPIFLLVVFSFTDSVIIGPNTWNGFTFRLYADLWKNKDLMVALGNTIIIAVTSALVSTIIGSLGAIGAFYSKKGIRKSIDNVTEIPIANAEIVMGLSLGLLFVFLGSKVFDVEDAKSYWTLLIGHVVLTIPFVYISVKPKLIQMDPSLYEAAIDLGCTPGQAIRKVIFPEVMPGVLSGFLLSVTLSLDDVVITDFTRGAGLLSKDEKIETLSTFIQSVIKKSSIPPEARALVSLIFIFIVVGVFIISAIQNKRNANKTLFIRTAHHHG